MSTCENIREFLAECDWDEAARSRAADALQHLQTCPQCAAFAADYDRIRSLLQPVTPGIPEGGWGAMEQRLLNKTLHRRGWAHFFGLAIAASVLVAVGYGIACLTVNRTARPSTLSQIDEPATQAAKEPVAFYPQSDVAHEAKAFHEVSDVFEHRTAWLLVGDNTSDVGLSDHAISDPQKILLLRLTMLRSGTTLSSADLAIVPGQSASLTVPGDRNTSVRYRITTSDELPTRLTISTELATPRGTEVLAALATTLRIESGQRLSAGNMVTSSGDYELQIAFARADADRDEHRPTN